MLSLPILLALGLASYRGTRFVVADSLTDPVRDFVAKKFVLAEGRTAGVWWFLNKLLNCLFCAGFWISVIALAFYLTVTDTWGHGVGPLLLHGLEAFVVAGVQALLSRWDDTREDDARSEDDDTHAKG